MPALRITHGEDDLRLGVMPHQLFVEATAWPIDGRLITLEQSLPIDGLSSCGGIPDPGVFEVRKDVNHVIAPGETKLFQGRLQRKSAGSSKSGADHLDWHEHLTITKTSEISSVAAEPKKCERPTSIGSRAKECGILRGRAL